MFLILLAYFLFIDTFNGFTRKYLSLGGHHDCDGKSDVCQSVQSLHGGMYYPIISFTYAYIEDNRLNSTPSFALLKEREDIEN